MGEKITDALVDKLVRDKVRGNFGGRLKVLVSGGAPLNTDIGIFFTALGLTLLQGYGQTESAPVISVNRLNLVKMETVGPPLFETEVKIAEDGEILVRGDLLMTGYWQNDEATNEVIKDGWLHTGDVGHMDEDNYIQITDRKKDIIVNSGGDNLSPQRVEGFLTLEPEIAQAMVYGDRKPHIVALIVPDGEFVSEWANETGNSAELSSIIENEDFHRNISEAIDRVNKHLSIIERVRRFVLIDQEFTVDNEMMTPTLKVRRHAITEKYGERLEALYGH
jgi:long-chain acyl-CoA synthetase